MPKIWRTLALGFALVLSAACQSTDQARVMTVDNPFRLERPIVVPPSPTPMQLCTSASLAEERITTQNIVDGAQRDARITGETALRDKLKRYEAQFELAHRSMVRSCQLYANCMDRNDADEMRCAQSSARLQTSEREMNNLIVDIERIAADVKTAKIRRASSHHPKKPHCPGKGCKTLCRSDCETTANVFTDDCCDLPH